ncbi:hypothetical protein TM49_16920 [Martelella endophytica]|uniref:Uncharacterized protein n=1 Tax=Martelella endophytica TaxID=1486262 RepID=A0A0D5LUF2_MAREN|nr:hypothetical protein TM49_16920 [Martelella endophytica]
MMDTSAGAGAHMARSGAPRADRPGGDRRVRAARNNGQRLPGAREREKGRAAKPAAQKVRKKSATTVLAT